jgi:predicted lactoylglutathione lyase
MARKIFVNLPVQDLARSIEFFSRLGFAFNAEFTDDKCASMVVSDEAYVMLLTREFYATFSPKSLADTGTHTEVILCVSAESRDEVDRLVATAIEAGGRSFRDRMEDGPMYGWGFEDPDGHLWEVMHMAA